MGVGGSPVRLLWLAALKWRLCVTSPNPGKRPPAAGAARRPCERARDAIPFVRMSSYDIECAGRAWGPRPLNETWRRSRLAQEPPSFSVLDFSCTRVLPVCRRAPAQVLQVAGVVRLTIGVGAPTRVRLLLTLPQALTEEPLLSFFLGFNIRSVTSEGGWMEQAAYLLESGVRSSVGCLHKEEPHSNSSKYQELRST